MNSMCRTCRRVAVFFSDVAVLASVGHVQAIFCKYGRKNGPNLRFCCRTCGKCGSRSFYVQVRHKKKNDPHRDGYESFLIFSKLAESEFCKVHITLLGESLVQGKSFVESVAGLAFLSYLEVIPHELLVVRMHAVLDDALGALGG